MATSHILAVGHMSKGSAQMRVAPRPAVETPAQVYARRATELREFAAFEGIKLPLSVDLIIWLEDRGHVVDLHTGKATMPHVGTPTPSGKAVSHLLTPTLTEAEMEAEFEDYREDIEDREFWAHGQW